MNRTRRSRLLWRLGGFLALGIVLFATLGPAGLRPRADLLDVNVERALAWGLIGLAFTLGYWDRLWFVVATLPLVPIGMEWAQNFIPNRHPRVDDALHKLIGLGLGMLAAVLLIWLTAWLLGRIDEYPRQSQSVRQRS